MWMVAVCHGARSSPGAHALLRGQHSPGKLQATSPNGLVQLIDLEQ